MNVSSKYLLLKHNLLILIHCAWRCIILCSIFSCCITSIALHFYFYIDNLLESLTLHQFCFVLFFGFESLLIWFIAIKRFAATYKKHILRMWFVTLNMKWTNINEIVFMFRKVCWRLIRKSYKHVLLEYNHHYGHLLRSKYFMNGLISSTSSEPMHFIGWHKAYSFIEEIVSGF